MISTHLPILQVIVPLIMAPVCTLIQRHTLLWLCSLAASATAVVIAALLLAQTYTQGTISYAIGGWMAPWGIEYRVDTLNAYVLLLVSIISTVVLLAARKSIEKEVAEQHRPLFYASYLLCLTGLLGITITGDAFNVFVFLEISSLSTYALISLGRDRRALTAAYQYLIMGTIGATFILIGIGMLYMLTGTLNMQDLAQRIPAITESRTLLSAFAFLFVGISLKLALFPLHLWLPNAYTYAPSIVSAFLAGTATKVAVYVMLRFLFNVFGKDYSFSHIPLSEILMALSVTAILFASLTAIYQQNIKRLFAYSSIAQLGYIMLGVSLLSVTSMTATLLHVFNHALMKAALFLTLACLMYRQGGVMKHNLNGLGRAMPWTFAALVIGGLSLVGVPLTVGFISKWYLVVAAIEQDQFWLVAIIMLGSLLALMYVWRLVEQGYFHQQTEGSEVREAPMLLLLPTWVLVLANIYFGIDTRLTIGGAEQAARILIGVSTGTTP